MKVTVFIDSNGDVTITSLNPDLAAVARALDHTTAESSTHWSPILPAATDRAAEEVEQLHVTRDAPTILDGTRRVPGANQRPAGQS
jgi:hypothetical protein